jgi:hypothetical protein
MTDLLPPQTSLPLPGLQLPALEGAVPWTEPGTMPRRPEEFTFVLLSDRTGLARPGVFERAVQVTNLLRPDFAIQVGDSIEGYTSDPAELAEQWEEFDGITAELQVPLFRVPGNHDVSNELMRDEWLRRHGALHYSFRHRDVLFVVLDTQDPPQKLSDFGGGEMTEAKLKELHELFARDPEAAHAWMKEEGLGIGGIDWEGTMPANLSEEQIAWAEQTIRANRDVRWTILLMHMPFWQGEGSPGFERIKAAFEGRSYTAYCGHVHNYKRALIDGNEHIRLGPTGGLWVLPGDEGNFDHVGWVTMTEDGPQMANIVLEGVLGAEGGTYVPLPRVGVPS